MDEYIKREEIRRAYEKLARSYMHGEPYIADWKFDEMIEELPAADVVPVRHGRWIEKQEKDTFAGYLYSYECSECGRVKQRKEPYCPNCGAKMDGGRTDEYIEREALMKETDRQRGEFISNKTIQFFPDTDVIPVRHGRWNDWEVFWKECSCCQYRTQKINAREYFFCPKCGAKMDGDYVNE